MHFQATVFALLLFSAIGIASPLAEVSSVTKRGPTCKDVKFTVNIEAYNADLSSINPANILGSVTNFVFSNLISGTFDIAGRYCEPENQVPSRQNTLQFLVHGATYDRDFWSGHGYNGTQYSWADIASKLGYPTLAIDRLGSGSSSHPDPITVVQYPAQSEALHKVILAIRNGSPQLPRPFNKIIWIGHSYGSIIGQSLVSKYENDVDALILTGYSSQLIPQVPIIFANALLLPARVVMPLNPKYNTLNPGYLMSPNRAGVDFLFFNPNFYDLALADLDFSLRGTMSIGEVALTLVATNNALKYTNPVFVVTGEKDKVFCLGGCGTNTTGTVANTKGIFPVTSSFDAWVVKDAGHSWQFHLQGPRVMRGVHDWIAGKGF